MKDRQAPIPDRLPVRDEKTFPQDPTVEIIQQEWVGVLRSAGRLCFQQHPQLGLLLFLREFVRQYEPDSSSGIDEQTTSLFDELFELRLLTKGWKFLRQERSNIRLDVLGIDLVEIAHSVRREAIALCDDLWVRTAGHKELESR